MKNFLFLLNIMCCWQVMNIRPQEYVHLSGKTKKFFGTPADFVTLYDINHREYTSSSWTTWTWHIISHPLVVPLVFMTIKPVVTQVESVIINFYADHWLSDDKKEEMRLQKQQGEEERRQNIALQATELQVRKDPRWKEFVIISQQQEADRGKQALILGEQQLAENNLLLSKARRESEMQEQAHLKQLIQNASPEARGELQKEMDLFIMACMKKRRENGV